MKNKITGMLTRNTKTTTLKKSKKRKISSTLWLNRQLNDVYVNSAKEEGYYARSAYKLIEINQKFNLIKPYDNVIDLGAAPGGWSQVASKLILPKEHNHTSAKAATNNIATSVYTPHTASKSPGNTEPSNTKDDNTLKLSPITHSNLNNEEDTINNTAAVAVNSTNANITPNLNSAVPNKRPNKQGQIIAVDLLDTKALAGNVTSIKGDFLDEDVIKQILQILGTKKANVILSDMAPNTTGNSDIDHIRIINLIEAAFHFALQVLAINGSFVAKVFQGGLESNLLKQVKSHFKEVKHFKPLASRKESKEIYLVAKGFKGADLSK